MKRCKCKNCVSFYKRDDGVVLCAADIRVIDPESCQPNGRACYERAEKKKLTPSELSIIRSNAGRKGGRKAGYGKGRAPTKCISVRKHDYDAFSKYSAVNNRPLAEQFHVIARQIVIKHPELKPPGWID